MNLVHSKDLFSARKRDMCRSCDIVSLLKLGEDASFLNSLTDLNRIMERDFALLCTGLRAIVKISHVDHYIVSRTEKGVNRHHIRFCAFHRPYLDIFDPA